MSTSLYETFGNEVNYEVRKDKLVKFLENSTIELSGAIFAHRLILSSSL